MDAMRVSQHTLNGLDFSCEFARVAHNLEPLLNTNSAQRCPSLVQPLCNRLQASLRLREPWCA